MPPSNCFETGRRSPTQSSVRPFGPRQQMDVWFSIEEEPPPRGTKASWRNLKTFVSAPPRRVRRAFALLTRTYHGCRLLGNYRSQLLGREVGILSLGAPGDRGGEGGFSGGFGAVGEREDTGGAAGRGGGSRAA